MSTTPAIAVTPGEPDSLSRVELEVPEPGHGDVLIDVIRCGICGTDREVASGHVGEPPPGQQRIVLGHEVLGRVGHVGEGVTDIQPGDLVTATVRRPDGCPSCQAGQVDMCEWQDYKERGIKGLDGYLAGQIVVEHTYVIPVPEHLETSGVLIEPLTVLEKAVRQAKLIQQRMVRWEPSTAIVAGAGPIGILGTLLLRSLGLNVYTVARTPAPNSRASMIEQTGAHYVSTKDESITELAARIGNVDVIIESTGSSAAVFESIQALGINGVLMLLSITDGSVHLDVAAGKISNRLVLGNRAIVGSVNAGIEDFTSSVSRLERFEELWPGLTASMITHRIPLNGDLSGIFHEPDDAIKTVVEFN